MDIYPWTHDPCNLEAIRMCEKISKWQVVMFVALLGSSCEVQSMVAAPMQKLHEHQ